MSKPDPQETTQEEWQQAMGGMPVGPQRALPTIRITPHNADARIRDAMEVLIRCWDEWEAAASAEAQKHQDEQFWFEEMQDQLGAVLTGMVCDPCRECGGYGIQDSGGVEPDGRPIYILCEACNDTE